MRCSRVKLTRETGRELLKGTVCLNTIGRGIWFELLISMLL